MLLSGTLFFFFKQKTAYEMRISVWSSDVCSSDLAGRRCRWRRRRHEPRRWPRRARLRRRRQSVRWSASRPAAPRPQRRCRHPRCAAGRREETVPERQSFLAFDDHGPEALVVQPVVVLVAGEAEARSEEHTLK